VDPRWRVGESIADLRFIALLIKPRDAAEKAAAVEVLPIADALQLQDEVGKLLRRLQIATAVLDVQPAFLRDRIFRPIAFALVDLPAIEVLAVEQRLQSGRTQTRIVNLQDGVGRDGKTQ